VSEWPTIRKFPDLSSVYPKSPRLSLTRDRGISGVDYFPQADFHNTSLDSSCSNRTCSQLCRTFTADESGILRRGRYHLKFLVSLRGQREFLLLQRRI
jgi:hypothetical protein